MTLNELLDWIANQGFSIAVAAFLLIRIDGKLDRLLLVLEGKN